MDPRGIRNKNPGNIEWSAANNWLGQIGKEPKGRFAIFDEHENGIRALGKILQTYYRKHKLRTIRGILNRYAPPVENDTPAYVRAVAARCGIGPDEDIADIRDPKVLGSLMHGVIKHENSNYEYPPAVFNEGLRRALA